MEDDQLPTETFEQPKGQQIFGAKNPSSVWGEGLRIQRHTTGTDGTAHVSERFRRNGDRTI